MAAWPAEVKAFPDEPYSLDEAPDGVRDDALHIWADLAFSKGNRGDGSGVLALSPLFGVRVQFAKHVIMDAQWGLSYAKVDVINADSESSVRLGNPFLGFHYQGGKKTFSYRAGIGLTAPAATLPDEIDERPTAQTAYTYAAGMRGNWNYFLWYAHAMTVYIPVRVERRKPSGFIWGAEFGAGIMISLNDKNINAKNVPIIQMEGDVGYQATKWLRVGSRFALVIMTNFDAEKTQVSAEPYARFGNETGFGAIRLLLNLDNPHGFSLDKQEIWGLRFGGGFSF